MSVEVKIEGLESVQEKLKRLGNPRLIKNAARRSMRKAMAIVRDAARSGAKAIDDPQTAEKIWKNIAIAAGKTRNPSEVVMRVGVRGGASFSNPNPPKTPGGDTRHWRWLEFGSVHNPPTPFMRPALQNNIQAVTNSFAENFNKEIDKELAKL
ncbi:HK97-gp10 family putative phage morphogenesis protein [Acinetobacter indicus]|uniref:HK97-gp10 family putative phage morphogenesis protein n=1 Tax=Acinetobacter indicus TaxID=756892 RepID=UPI002E3337DD|nr:HK97-gp10 family putative phage morphogenesis protein [Acinetobacter indicus]